MARKITHYTTLDRFGNRPVVSVDTVKAETGGQAPAEWGRFWAVYASGKAA